MLFAGELLKEIRCFIEDGVPPQTIIKGFRKASQLVGRNAQWWILSFSLLYLSLSLSLVSLFLGTSLPATPTLSLLPPPYLPTRNKQAINKVKEIAVNISRKDDK